MSKLTGGHHASEIDRRSLLAGGGAALIAGALGAGVAQAQRAGAGGGFAEATASVYHHTVGEIDVLIISDGLFEVSAQAIGTNASRDEVDTWLSEQFLGGGGFDTPLNTMLIRTGDRLVLIDAGMGSLPGFDARAGHTLDRLARAGVDAKSITDIVLTHMHPDHIGALVSGKGLGAFSDDVSLYVSEREAEFWSQREDAVVDQMPAVLREMAPFTVKLAQQALNAADGRVKTFNSRDDGIAPGVFGQVTPGHTPGHATISVESGDEPLVFVGDALIWTSFDHPDWSIMFDTDPEAAGRTRQQLLAEFARQGTLICASHLSFPSLGRVVKSGSAYRFVPMIWNH